MVLTHNNDLLRLLDVQVPNCYNLYFLNNTAGENVGFISLSEQEKDIAIYLNKLLRLFRAEIFSYIVSHELFLMSMIPFMRGYAHVIDNETLYKELTSVMHGYETDMVDLAAAYRKKKKKPGIPIPASFPNSFVISVADILSTQLSNSPILDRNQFPLLDKTLRHSLT